MEFSGTFFFYFSEKKNNIVEILEITNMKMKFVRFPYTRKKIFMRKLYLLV